jgi:hypothetical protein
VESEEKDCKEPRRLDFDTHNKKLNEDSRHLELEVVECLEEIAEVTTLGGSGFRFVVNLHERTCSCRKWQVFGIPCKHAIAFITSLHNAPLENYVDAYYSIEKFRATYTHLILAMNDKSQWSESNHGFFMHPPLLKPTAGRPRNERFKGSVRIKGPKGSTNASSVNNMAIIGLHARKETLTTLLLHWK